MTATPTATRVFLEGDALTVTVAHAEGLATARLLNGNGDVVWEGEGTALATVPASQFVVPLGASCSPVCDLVVRSNDLYRQMSAYLARRIERTVNIEVLLNSNVQRMAGNGQLATTEIVNKVTGEIRMLPTAALFSFIGAMPRTDWLPKDIETDDRGFVRTGPAVEQLSPGATRRAPFLLETSRRGVFAAGDVRASSVKRVASAVGEGSMAIQFIHEYLKGM